MRETGRGGERGRERGCERDNYSHIRTYKTSIILKCIHVHTGYRSIKGKTPTIKYTCIQYLPVVASINIKSVNSPPA